MDIDNLIEIANSEAAKAINKLCEDDRIIMHYNPDTDMFMVIKTQEELHKAVEYYCHDEPSRHAELTRLNEHGGATFTMQVAFPSIIGAVPDGVLDALDQDDD